MASHNRTTASEIGRKVIDIPGIPTIGTATAGGESISVTFTADSSGKGGAASSYIAKSSPGNITGTSSTSPVIIEGLTVGTSYTATVAAVNSTGTSEYSSVSNSAVPTIATAYQSIATVTVGSGGQSTISFTSIPSTFKHLQIRYIARSTNANSFAGFIYANFNNDTTSGNYYARHRLNGRGDNLVYSDASAGSGASEISYVAGGNTAANGFSSGIIDVIDYTSTTKNKTIKALSGLAGQTTDTNNDVALVSSLYFPSTIAAISRIDFTIPSTNFAQYSQFALYGIKGS
jgi:hypothetical protein